MLDKPERVFDREFEWDRLSAFADRASGASQFGVVSGRRRQGKTFLLEALAQATGGWYFNATEATEAESLRQFGGALAARTGAVVPPRFSSWDEAIRYVFATTGLAGQTVVIDEFPYLSKVSPVLPSIIAREVDRAATAARGPSLLLCGSAMSVMGRLLAGSAPLRGRANLELVVRPFGHRLAARFWGIADPRLALTHNAIVGGTPAYRRFVNQDAPADGADFDGWVTRSVLDPSTPLFREARYLLDEEADVRDTAVYHSVLAAVATGHNTRGGIASYVGRNATDIGHHLNVLEDCGLVRRNADVFRSGRSVYRVAEPLVAFYQAVMRPQWALLEIGRASAVWADARGRFAAQVIGPHFEQVCRDFAVTAAQDVYGGPVGEVGAGVVADPTRRGQIEVDVVVFASAVPGEPRRILSLGEAKWGDVMDARHVQRLARARDLLAGRGYDTRDTLLACYSGAGFEPDLSTADGVVTVGLERLYE